MQEGSSTRLVLKIGRKYAHAIVMGTPVDVLLIDKHIMGLRPMLLKGLPYPVERAINMMLKAGQTLGITRRAEVLLKGESDGQSERKD